MENPTIHPAKKEALECLCRKHGLALVYLFGSQATRGARLLAGEVVAPSDPLADLDIGVVTLEPLPPPAERYQFYARLFNDLEDLVRPFPLDLVLLEENHSVFQLEAIKGICIYQVSEVRREEYEMSILRRAADFRPVLETFYREQMEEFEGGDKMINRLLVEQRLALIHSYLQSLEKLAQMERSDFLADPTKAAAAESFLRRALEASFDIGRHLLAKQGAADLAGEYKSIARGLGEKGIVSPELADKLVQMAGYRNRLVHLYHLISDEELYQIITHDLGDLRSFAEEIYRYLTRR